MTAQPIVPENQKLFDRSIQHYMQTRRLEKDLRIRQERLTKKQKTLVRTLLRKGIRAPLKKVYAGYVKSMKQLGLIQVRNFVTDEVDFHSNNLLIYFNYPSNTN